MTKFTSALKATGHGVDGHITLSFCDVQKAGKFQTTDSSQLACVYAIEYWGRVNLTVALVDSPLAWERFEYWSGLGYTYDLEFIPHITLGEGDLTKKYEHLIGEAMLIDGEYARLY